MGDAKAGVKMTDMESGIIVYCPISTVRDTNARICYAMLEKGCEEGNLIGNVNPISPTDLVNGRILIEYYSSH